MNRIKIIVYKIAMVWNACKEEASTANLTQEYSIVRNILRTSPEMPNARKNVEKLAQEIYLSVFHPLEHLKFWHSLTRHSLAMSSAATKKKSNPSGAEFITIMFKF